MSIIFTHGNNVLLCHPSYINHIYRIHGNVIDENDDRTPRLCAKVKECIFDLNLPFGGRIASNDPVVDKRKKARKKKEHAAISENAELYSLVNGWFFCFPMVSIFNPYFVFLFDIFRFREYRMKVNRF